MSGKLLMLGLLVAFSAHFSGCSVSNYNRDNSGPSYYPKPPLGVSTTDAAEKELALLLRNTPVRINFNATSRFPNHVVLKNFVDNTKPDLSMATHLWYQNADPILRIEANGITVSAGRLALPVYPTTFDELVGFSIKLKGGQIELPNGVSIYIRDDIEQAQKIFDHLSYILKNMDKGNLAEFEKKAARYRSFQAKPKMEEEQRKLIVQANAFNQHKNYDKAIEKYLTAVDINATSYPAAYYNLALLYAQQNNPHRAIYYMKHYLLLEPEAKDARSAQDKIYEWEAMLEAK